MRYRCPDECAGVSHAGTTLIKDAEGLIEAAEDAAAALAPHGILPLTADGAEGKAGRRNRTDDRRMLR